MAYINDIFEFAPVDNLDTPASDLLVSRDKVGVEIELEGVGAAIREKNFTRWNLVRDGSLRDNGIEFVFNGPKGGMEVEKALLEIEKKVAPGKPKVNERCGLHVHVDVRDLTPKQLKSFLLLSIMFEDVFMKKTGNRDNNIFCCKFKTSDAQLNFVSVSDKLRKGSVGIAFKDVRKYGSVNMLSIYERGSVEFRYHKGSYDKDEILVWINTLLSMKVYSRRPDINPDELTQAFSNDGGLDLFHSVMGDDLFEHYLDEDTEVLLKDGMRLAQDAILMGNLRKQQRDIYRGMHKEGYVNQAYGNFVNVLRDGGGNRKKDAAVEALLRQARGEVHVGEAQIAYNGDGFAGEPNQPVEVARPRQAPAPHRPLRNR